MGSQSPQALVPLSRPVLEVDGVQLHHGLLGFQVEEFPSAPSRCRVVLTAPALETQPPGSLPTFGQAFTLSMEAPDSGVAPELLFQGRIIGLGRGRDEGNAPRIELEAADALYSLATTRRSRVFQEMAAGDILPQVAASHGLTAQVGLPPLASEVIVQADETDLALLRRLAQQTDGDFWVEGSTLHFVPFGQEGEEPVRLSADTDLLEYRIRADLSQQRAEVEVRGWDPGVKEAIAEGPGPGDAGVLSSPLASPLASPLGSGPQVVTESWGWGLPPTEPSVHLGPSTPQEARRWATAWSRSLERSFVELQGTVGPGPPWIRPRLHLELSDAGPQFSGRYRVVACRHLMNSHDGFRTEFRALRGVSHRRGTSHE